MYYKKLIVSYDGTDFLGWQETKMGLSIESTLGDAFEKIFQKRPKFEAASRTDRGVHASGQVVCCSLPKEIKNLQNALNRYLPKSVRIIKVESVASTFHPSLSAKIKEYHYHVDLREVFSPFERRYYWHYPYEINIDKMRRESKKLIGTHDFSSFSNVGGHPDTIRTIESIEIEGNEKLKFIISGKSFLYKMVRNLVGSLLYVGRGEISNISDLIDAKDRKCGGVCAPAHGLTLKHVSY